MARFIIKIEDKYFEWSTVVDAPITYGLTREQFEDYYRGEYGAVGMEDLPNRLARADTIGTSSLMGYKSVEEAIAGNRAGPNETELTADEILVAYRFLD